MSLRVSRIVAGLVVLTALLVLPGTVRAQDTSIQALQGLSTATIENIIESARPDDPATLMIANRNITVLRAAVLGRTSAERVNAVRELITDLTRDGRHADVTYRLVSTGSVISVSGRDVLSLLPADTDQLVGETVEAKASAAVARLQQALDEIEESRRPRVVLWGAVQALLGTFVFAALLWVLSRANGAAGLAAERTTERKLSRSSVGDQIVRETNVLYYIRRSITMALIVVALSIAYVWVQFVLRRFPYTRPWGDSLRAFLVDLLASFGERIISSIPNLFTVVLIVVVTRFAIRLVQLLFVGVEQQRLTLPGVHPETAATTRKLVTCLLWLFAVAICYPYLPGSETDAFKGVSVFVGLMLSLGSSASVNQIMSGFTLTYSRALRAGDYVRVGEIEGTVSAMGMLSTKIDTPLHEEVTIPNAVLISQVVTNFSRDAEGGVFARTEVTIGYDAPWRQVEAMLLQAASQTPGVRSHPAPMVRQSALEDFYVRYRLLVCVEQPHLRLATLHRLHANIQDAFNEHGVQIMSPNYEADPAQPKIVPKSQWFAKPAKPQQDPSL